jgi:lambda repressor-like predicted transcriptional regulator
LHKRADEVFALKKQGRGLRVISRELRMAVSSVHSVLAGRKSKR